MKKGLIGVQMMMFGGKVREMGAYAVLQKLAEIGYHCIEISQIPMTPENVAGIKQACEAFDIKVAAWLAYGSSTCRAWWRGIWFRICWPILARV